MNRWILGTAPVAALIVCLAGSARADMFYVRSIASASTSGNILNGQSASSDTGQVQALSNSAGPLGASSSGTFYDFNASADVVTAIGVVRGSAVASAQSSGPAGGANASAQGQWSDTITITSASLPGGTPVLFQATILLRRTLSGASPAQASADVTGPFGLSLHDSLASPNPMQSVSTVVNTTVGSVLSATSTLSLSAGAAGIAPFNLSASARAEDTAVFEFDPITPGASYTTASGVQFSGAAVPEPSSLVLAAVGLSAVPVWLFRRRRRDGSLGQRTAESFRATA